MAEAVRGPLSNTLARLSWMAQLRLRSSSFFRRLASFCFRSMYVVSYLDIKSSYGGVGGPASGFAFEVATVVDDLVVLGLGLLLLFLGEGDAGLFVLDLLLLARELVLLCFKLVFDCLKKFVDVA